MDKDILPFIDDKNKSIHTEVVCVETASTVTYQILAGGQKCLGTFQVHRPNYEVYNPTVPSILTPRHGRTY